MAAVLLTLGFFTMVFAFVAAVVYVVMTVREHMETSPAAAKAIYEHVFLPVVGIPVSEPSLASPTPSLPDPEIDPQELVPDKL